MDIAENRSQTEPIVIIDSGVGGLSLAESFIDNVHDSVVYVADTAGFPYGVQIPEELLEHLEQLITHCIRTFATRRIIIACNTATIIAIEAMRKKFPEVTFVGTVPPIKMLERYARNTRFGLLASETTSFHGYAKKLHQLFSSRHQMVTIPATQLIADIEDFAPQWDHPTVCRTIEELANSIRAMGIQTLVHGCTHFFHVIPVFKRYLPQLGHLDATEGVVQRAQSLFESIEPSEPSQDEGGVHENQKAVLYTTNDEPQQKWAAIAKVFSLEWKGNMMLTTR